MDTENELMQKMSLDEHRPTDESDNYTVNDQEISFDIDENIDTPIDEQEALHMRRVQYKQSNNRSKKGTQICLQRISQRVKKTNGFFWSGHMFYYTSSDPVVSYHWYL